jgi:hypothetical protein
LIQKHAGHETAAMLLSGYILIGSLLDVGEGLWRGGQLTLASQQVANDFQIYGALALAFLLTLTVAAFTRRDLRLWLGIGAFWILGSILIVLNVFRFGAAIWTSGNFSLTFDRLLPGWAALGWLVFILGSVLVYVPPTFTPAITAQPFELLTRSSF